jgi:hypothetical protein
MEPQVTLHQLADLQMSLDIPASLTWVRTGDDNNLHRSPCQEDGITYRDPSGKVITRAEFIEFHIDLEIEQAKKKDMSRDEYFANKLGIDIYTWRLLHGALELASEFKDEKILPYLQGHSSQQLGKLVLKLLTWTLLDEDERVGYWLNSEGYDLIHRVRKFDGEGK